MVTDNVDFIGTDALPKGVEKEEVRYTLAVFGSPPANREEG
jgi:hypothetical protein